MPEAQFDLQRDTLHRRELRWGWNLWKRCHGIREIERENGACKQDGARFVADSLGDSKKSHTPITSQRDGVHRSAFWVPTP